VVRAAFAAGVVLMLLAALVYPIQATRWRVRMDDRFPDPNAQGAAQVAAGGFTNNGMDFMQKAVYQDDKGTIDLRYDYDAIMWMRNEVVGSPTIIEGQMPLYRWGSRFSIYTGLPTVIGWDWHEKQQRSIIDGAIIDRRLDAVRQIYNSPSPDEALALVKRFRVAYIYIGDVERAFYDQVGLAKFDAMVRAGQLQLVYQNERVKIFQVSE
jgi:uncharacterized membrane protein